MTQADIKELTGISESTISRIEKNEVSPSSNFILQICKSLSVSADWLLMGKELPLESLEDSEMEILELFNKLPQDEKYILIGRLRERTGSSWFGEPDISQKSQKKSALYEENTKVEFSGEIGVRADSLHIQPAGNKHLTGKQ